jgi:hypothetical protein
MWDVIDQRVLSVREGFLHHKRSAPVWERR